MSTIKIIHKKMDDIKKAYDLMSNEWSNEPNGAQMTEFRTFLKMIGKVKGLKILDAGCGTGEYSIILAKKGAECVGIDFSKGMINHAKINAKNNNVDIDFKKADICNLPFKDNVFDKVISSRVLNFIKEDNLDLAIKELLRVLKKGGELTLSLIHPGLGISDRTIIKIKNIIYQIPKYTHSIEAYKKAFIKNKAKIIDKNSLKMIKSFKKINPELYKTFEGKEFILLFKLKKLFSSSLP